MPDNLRLEGIATPWMEELGISVLIPVFMGYMPKITAKRDSWLQNDHVAEICSASTCISESFKPLKEELNKWGLYSSPDLEIETTCDIYAYNLLPVKFETVKQIPLEITGVSGNRLSGYEFLGYDIVTFSEDNQIACSPLSCNGGAEIFKVNQFCLIDTIDDAWQVCSTIASESSLNRWEEGPYVLLEVYRKSKKKMWLFSQKCTGRRVLFKPLKLRRVRASALTPSAAGSPAYSLLSIVFVRSCCQCSRGNA